MLQQEDRVTQGTLRTSTGAPLPLQHTDVKALITGPVARVEVKQVFRNDTGGPIEAVYLFPLPHEASVYAMRFRIGARTVEAVVKEKEEAKRAYEAARREGRSATLLEQDRPNLFTLSVANIPPGETIEVELAYQERLGFDEDEFRFVFPMVTTERYHAGAPTGAAVTGERAAATDQVPDAPRVRPPRAATGERAADIALSLEIHADPSAEPPRSPSHRVVVEPKGPGRFHVRLHEGDSIPNRDFVIAFAAAGQGVRPRAYFERQPDKVGTFLLVVTPPAAPPEVPPSAERDAGGATVHRCTNCGGALRDPAAVKEHPGLGKAFRCAYCGVIVSVEREGAKVGLPRDVVFLVDRSCSMRGGSVPQARRAVRLILEHLDAKDAVQCFAFDHDRVAADGRGEAWLPNNEDTVADIDKLLAGASARGGTELEEALERAAKLPLRKDRTKLVVLITDAAVGNEGRLLRRAPELLGPDTRLYVLGIGPAVNRYLVERLARAAGGASDVLLPGEDVETVVPRFARRVRQAGPVLRKLRLSWEDAAPLDVYPSPIPDLFGGQTVQLLGRFNGEGKSRMVLTAERATGEPFRQEIEVTLPEAAEDIPGLTRLWARLRIDARLARLSEAPGEAAEVRLEVLSLALKHALLSPYTALVAEDSEKRVTEPAKRVQVKAEATAELTEEEEAEEEEEEEEEEEVERADEAVLLGFKKGAPGPAADGSSRGGPAAELSLMDDDAHDDGISDLMESERAYTRAGTISSTRAGTLKRGSMPKLAAAPAAPPAFGAPGGAPPPPPAYAPPPAARPAAPATGAPPPEPSFVPPLAAAPMAGMIPPPSLLSAPEPEAAPRKRGGLISAIKDFFGGGGKEKAEEADESIAPAPADEPVPAPRMDALPHEPPRPKPVPPPSAQPTQPAAKPKRRASGSDEYPAEVLAEAKRRGIGELDLVFLVDETGSMGSYIEQVKQRLLELIDALRAAPLCRSLRLGIVSYRDHPPEERTFVSRVVPLTEDIASIRKGVERMEARGGGDGPEAVTDGLYDLVRLDWRPRAARVVVWVGDAPPHGVEPGGDGFPDGCPCGHHWYAQAESCREMGVAIYAVGCLPTLHSYAGAEDVYKTVATTTRGLYLPLSEAHLLIPLIAGAAETELDRQRIEEHIADVIAQYEEELRRADDQEKVRFVTDVLRDQGVRPRSMQYNASRPEAPPLRFRDLVLADVASGLEELRRLGRTTL